MKLSVIDHTVLGIIWRDGPTTAYRAMRVLAASPSTFYRNRAATTYRVVQRLIRDGLMEPVGTEIGPRKDRQIRITPKGLKVLQKWLSSPIPFGEIAHSVDLIRLRMYSAGAITPKERVAFVDDALAELRRYLALVETDIEQEQSSGDFFGALGSLGSRHETLARIAWLEEIRPKLLALP